MSSNATCSEHKTNHHAGDWHCTLHKGHPGPHVAPNGTHWRPPWREYPYGMRHKTKAPQSSSKAYPWGQASVHCRVCCRTPTSSTHFIKPAAPGNCGGEFGCSGSEKTARCPRCGSIWISGVDTPIGGPTT